jgi:hypothetical protein
MKNKLRLPIPAVETLICMNSSKMEKEHPAKEASSRNILLQLSCFSAGLNQRVAEESPICSLLGWKCSCCG